ncbi:hypothetical protein [Cesiribacter andamanensis]|uniref:Uncharacterized protein n=1 Tax=Cesiribacter andamanensis AMV16 TaxID=1279009 RepID=M7N143_9BACT|nr:hypothetical protein [Cesiribacter andamanensis]EMR01022.1 hypothetical protein ADICEAN_03854 [Cesiribacter andamanensis AMV16]
MLSVGVSLNGGIRSLERALRMRVEGLGKALMEGLLAAAPKAVAAEEILLSPTPGLRIARTTLPDQPLDFNQTFLHIHQELKALYQHQQPLAQPAAASTASLENSRAQEDRSPEGRTPEGRTPEGRTPEDYLATVSQLVGGSLLQQSVSDRPARRAAPQGLKVARTILPDQPMDFNQTFRHIHTSLKTPYQPGSRV